MSIIIVVVVNVFGKVWVEVLDGICCFLEVGDVIMVGECFIIVENIQFVLDFGYGEIVVFGGGFVILVILEMVSDYIVS